MGLPPPSMTTVQNELGDILTPCSLRPSFMPQSPRIECPTHGVQAITVPWSEKHSRFTILFERLAIDLLRSTQNQTSAQKLLNLSWEEVHHIQEKAVKRGLHRRQNLPLFHLGVDEKNFKKNHSLCDPHL